MNFSTYLKQKAKLAEKGLTRFINQPKNAPQILIDAMDYSIQAGGKRLRPVLVMATAEAFGKKASDVIAPACAIEMLHTYSLIHDDLPCLDNDDLRRNKPTSHKVYGEDLALLAGDGLLTYVFEVFCKAVDSKNISAQNTLTALSYFSKCAGCEGMVGGQVADIFAEGVMEGKSKRQAKLKNLKNKKLEYFALPKNSKEISVEALLEYIHKNKTGALITASVMVGSILAGASKSNLKLMEKYGQLIGLAFQIVDDILDETTSEKKLGKSKSDKQHKKLTFVSLYGLEESKKQADKAIKQSKKILDKVKVKNRKKLEPLYSLADFIQQRSN